VTVVVPPASVVALLGANGAGKTTLLRVGSGLLAPDAGRIVFDGRDLTGAPPHVLARAGLCHVPEGRGVFPTLTIRDNLLIQAEPGREDEAVERAVAAFPVLGRRLNQAAGTLSGGERQMLALARSYVRDPSVVLLDEVSMGLAPKIVDEIFESIAALASRGAALLLVEQYATRALALADYVYVLRKGSVAFAGEPSELEGRDVMRAYVGGHAGAPAGAAGWATSSPSATAPCSSAGSTGPTG
jgi:branched-chain amino acid transport system ATP-binding protein